MTSNTNEDLLLVGTYSSHNVETLPSTPLELGTSTSLEVPSDQYNLMLEAGTRDIRYNPSLTNAPQYPGGPDQLLVGTYPGHSVETIPPTSLELGTCASHEDITSHGYGLEAGIRDVRHNASLTEPHQYLGGSAVTPSVSYSNVPFLSMSETGHHQQQRENKWPETLLSEYYLLLKRISDSLDLEQVKSLCFISVEAMKAGICNRNDFSGIVLLDFFHKMMLISPNDLTYLTSKLHSIDRMDLCSLIGQYNSRMLSPQPLPCGDFPVEERPLPYNPPYKPEVPTHGKCRLRPVHHVSSANTIQPMAPMLGSLSEQNSYSLPFQVQEDDVPQMEYNRQLHLETTTSNCSQVINRLGRVENSFEPQREVMTYLTVEQLRIKQLEEQVARLQSRLQEREDLVVCQGNVIIKQEDTIDHRIQIIKHKSDLIESLINFPISPVEKYEMNKFPHGIAVIINIFEFYLLNPSFEPPLPDRPGSCADEEHLRSTWEYLGYYVCIFRNLTALDLTQRLEQISKQSHKEYDSFVCCILGHGYLDGIYGADSKPVEISGIASLFKPINCPTLAGKPKMFFIHACRGENKDPRFSLQKDRNADIEESFLPNDTDFLFGYATPPGNVSWISHCHGTWYISCLCEVLSKYALQRDLLTMLTIVNYRVSEAYTDKGYKQCPAPVSQLRKQVWFFSKSAK